MIRLNLLPHREIRKAQQTRQFYILCGAALIAGAATAFLGYQYLDSLINNQNARNAYVQSKIDVLNGQIKEIDALKAERQALLARKGVVEKLQTNRSEVVQLMDQLTRLTPEGMYLTSVKQKDVTVEILGLTQSNARVSTFIRNIESSPLLMNPMLREIKTATEGKFNQFSMVVTIRRAAPEGTASAPQDTPKKG